MRLFKVEFAGRDTSTGATLTRIIASCIIEADNAIEAAEIAMMHVQGPIGKTSPHRMTVTERMPSAGLARAKRKGAHK